MFKPSAINSPENVHYCTSVFCTQFTMQEVTSNGKPKPCSKILKTTIYKFSSNDSVAIEYHNSLCLVHTSMVSRQTSNGTEDHVMQIVTTANKISVCKFLGFSPRVHQPASSCGNCVCRLQQSVSFTPDLFLQIQISNKHKNKQHMLTRSNQHVHKDHRHTFSNCQLKLGCNNTWTPWQLYPQYLIIQM